MASIRTSSSAARTRDEDHRATAENHQVSPPSTSRDRRSPDDLENDLRRPERRFRSLHRFVSRSLDRAADALSTVTLATGLNAPLLVFIPVRHLDGVQPRRRHRTLRDRCLPRVLSAAALRGRVVRHPAPGRVAPCGLGGRRDDLRSVPPLLSARGQSGLCDLRVPRELVPVELPVHRFLRARCPQLGTADFGGGLRRDRPLRTVPSSSPGACVGTGGWPWRSHWCWLPRSARVRCSTSWPPGKTTGGSPPSRPICPSASR